MRRTRQQEQPAVPAIAAIASSAVCPRDSETIMRTHGDSLSTHRRDVDAGYIQAAAHSLNLMGI